MVANILVVLFLVPIYASDFAQGGTIGRGAATTPSGTGSGGACTGSICDDSDFADGGTTGNWAVYGRGILVDGGSSSGADGSLVGHSGGCQDGGSGVIMV